MERRARHLIALIAALTACMALATTAHAEPPAATVRLDDLQSHTPKLKLKLRAGDAPLSKVTMVLPEGLRFTKRRVFNEGASAKADDREIAGDDLRHSPSRVRIVAFDAERATATFKRGALIRGASPETLDLSFPVHVVDTAGTRTPLVVPGETN